MNAVDTQAPLAHFERLFREEADPWHTATRWYESRKRALTLASLPRERFERAFEPGCGAGETTAALATRCNAVIATDASPSAVARARQRVQSMPHVRVDLAELPFDFPDGRFDLIVVSEIGYYLSGDHLGLFGAACRSSLAARGVLVACHWRRQSSDMALSADAVHASLAHLGLRSALHGVDDDFLLDVWTADPQSVAAREGLA